MGKEPINTGKKQMSDVALARSYVADIGGSGKVQAILYTAYFQLARMFPHKEEPKWQWTERRIRSFWNQEAAYVEFREMRELHEAAAKAKEERELLEKARKEHAAFVERTANLRTLLECMDPDFFGGEIARLGSLGCRVDRARTDRRRE